MSTVKYWIWLSKYTQLQLKTKAQVIERFGDAERAFFSPPGSFRQIEGVSVDDAEILEARDLDGVDRIIDLCRRQGIRIITLQDAEYPNRLRQAFSPPPVLYVKGNFPAVDESPVIAIIGTRKSSDYGVKMSQRLASETVKCGGTVLSVLTSPIDSAAAEGAVKAGGTCIAVLATPIDRERSAIANRILERGALVSEYPPETQVQKEFFRARNRIAAGLSVGVCVVEAPIRSGARLFADEACSQGKDIFAVPGKADDYRSAGTIDMLKNGAKPVTCGWDMLSEYEMLYPYLRERHEVNETRPSYAAAPEKAAAIPKKEIDREEPKGYIDLEALSAKLSDNGKRIVLALNEKPMYADEIIAATAMPAQTVLTELTMLEIMGVVKRESGKRYRITAPG